MSDILSKIEVFASGETIKHVTQGCIGVIFVTGKAYGIFTNDDFLCGIRHHESRLDLREEEGRGWGEDHNSGFDIVDDESNGESSIEVSNEANTFVKLKNEDEANLFINVEKTIKTNYRKDVAKIWFVIKEVRKDVPSFVKEPIYKRLVNLTFFAGKASGTMIHEDVVGGVMMINVG
ncbi:hypothetical protein Tco_1494974 [Tanacetum coccineum]